MPFISSCACSSAFQVTMHHLLCIERIQSKMQHFQAVWIVSRNQDMIDSVFHKIFVAFIYFMDLSDHWTLYQHQAMTNMDYHIAIIISVVIQKYLMMSKHVEMVICWPVFKKSGLKMKIFCARMCIAITKHFILIRWSSCYLQLIKLLYCAAINIFSLNTV